MESFSISPHIDRHADCMDQLRGEGMLKSVDLNKYCKAIIRDMNKYGICIIDNFIDQQIGDNILSEVNNLYKSHKFKPGKVVNIENSAKVRGDVTYWTNGTEEDCEAIGVLMNIFDYIVIKCNHMKNNGEFSKYDIRTRSNAMIACYPGNDTGYRRHVDNSGEDGRCVTCIYYLNKDYDRERDGGLLRIFPVKYPEYVANIEPIFNRAIFFWSDKRNPHEVMPSMNTRFAITVWYSDARDVRKGKEETKVVQTNGNSSAELLKLSNSL